MGPWGDGPIGSGRHSDREYTLREVRRYDVDACVRVEEVWYFYEPGGAMTRHDVMTDERTIPREAELPRSGWWHRPDCSCPGCQQ